ncbi:DUF3078 domain-containing protein [Pseudocnuella soli]|uniref:DUF3078 domain-containing protein n=1 Tax=Pseudocnuella soli TaxID=2502779 RepID=UPI00104754D1|nr:DUF3078 domain-containing protein [Pseudocnuella soli]
MNRLLLILMLMCSTAIFAQDSTVKRLRDETSKAVKRFEQDTVEQKWKRGLTYNLAVTQGSLNNWAAGGDDFSLSATSVLNMFAFYKRGRNSWDNMLDFNLGYVKTSSLGERKNDDRLDFLSKYGYSVSDKWSIGGLFNFRSQLFNGYTFNTDDDPTLSSAFLSPAYITVSLGADFKPAPNLSIFISPITSRWVVVRNDSLSAKGLYGVDPGKTSSLELGAFLTANYIKEISKSVSYRGRLDLFSNYRHNPKNVDLFMTNVWALKLTNVLSFTWNLDLIYDDDVRIFGAESNKPALQVKSLLGAGLLVRTSNIRAPK